MIPFSADVFFSFLAQYNAAIWPTQIVTSLMALSVVYLALRPARHSGRIISGMLAVLWLWTGGVYHLSFFARINFWDLGFGVLFIIQSLLLIWSGVVRDRLAPAKIVTTTVSTLGLATLAVAFIFYPLLSAILGRTLAEIAWVGSAPAPTVILTLGLLCLCGTARLWGLAVIPLLLCLTGSLVAYLLPLPQDWLLLPVALGTLAAFMIKRKA